MRRNSPAAWLLLAGAAIVLFLSRGRPAHTAAPPFSLPETYGGRVDLASYKGQPVLLVFWTTTCGVCRRQLPLVNRLAPEFRSRGVGVATIHLGGKETARDYLRTNGIALTALVDEEGATGRAYEVSGVPKSVLVGGDGRLLRSHAGLLQERELREWMDAAAIR